MTMVVTDEETAVTVSQIPATRVTTRASEGQRRFGYLVAVVVNVVLMVVANNILDWGWVPFLTGDFGRLLWLIDASLAAAIVFNVLYMAYDPVWFRSATQVVSNLISIMVTVRMLQIFPFDFSAYEFDWEPLTRFALVVVVVGTVIAIIVDLTRLVRALTPNL